MTHVHIHGEVDRDNFLTQINSAEIDHLSASDLDLDEDFPMADLCSCITMLSMLRVLDLSGCGVGMSAARSLASSLQSTPKLEILDLSHNPLLEVGVKAIVATLSLHCPKIRHVDLSHTGLSPEVAGNIKQELEAIPSMDVAVFDGVVGSPCPSPTWANLLEARKKLFAEQANGAEQPETLPVPPSKEEGEESATKHTDGDEDRIAPLCVSPDPNEEIVVYPEPELRWATRVPPTFKAVHMNPFHCRRRPQLVRSSSRSTTTTNLVSASSPRRDRDVSGPRTTTTTTTTAPKHSSSSSAAPFGSRAKRELPHVETAGPGPGAYYPRSSSQDRRQNDICTTSSQCHHSSISPSRRSPQRPSASFGTEKRELVFPLLSRDPKK
eukprot:PhM_4_TR13354/c5_g1_i2/m.14086